MSDSFPNRLPVASLVGESFVRWSVLCLIPFVLINTVTYFKPPGRELLLARNISGNPLPGGESGLLEATDSKSA
jgi:hypothetical protein